MNLQYEYSNSFTISIRQLVRVQRDGRRSGLHSKSLSQSQLMATLALLVREHLKIKTLVTKTFSYILGVEIMVSKIQSAKWNDPLMNLVGSVGSCLKWLLNFYINSVMPDYNPKV